MEWLTQIVEGLNHEGQYHGQYGDDRIWNEPRDSVDDSSDFDREEIDRAIAMSLSEVDQKGKKVIDITYGSVREVLCNDISKETQSEGGIRRQAKAQLEEDEQLAKAIQESLSIEPPPQHDTPSIFQPFPFLYPPGYRTCAGCNIEIGHGRYLSCMGAFWHPECLRCHGCNQPITDIEFSMSGSRPYHKHCRKEQRHLKCDVCHNSIPTNSGGLIEYSAHPFWFQKYCPSHERDGTPCCCSCERMEVSCKDKKSCTLLSTHIHGNHHLPETRGLCLSEEQTVTTVFRRPRVGAGYLFVDTITEPYRLIRRCEVTAILILYSLPRLLAGSILAHEMMHAWLRLKGFICLMNSKCWLICGWILKLVLALAPAQMFLHRLPPLHHHHPCLHQLRMGKRSDFEKKLGEFFKHKIESDSSSAYGDGFREGNQAVSKYGLRRTLEHIRLTGNFPC
ncbi:hypothetical protein Patl1_28845 [Pistacia atlantica]|uniref:Uncharacterized protein n=1 Tax=Pistacia atlantica TaxID=434234 RepID=A0ACC1BGB1_9ROSI|nr:hypothetical protein Patl1_28845 [Pistacia atlantica]